MEAEMDAAMAADSATAEDIGNEASASPYESSRARPGPLLELPEGGEGIDFDMLDVPARQEGAATAQQVLLVPVCVSLSQSICSHPGRKWTWHHFM